MATTWSRDIESDPGQQKWHTALRARRCSESRAEHAKLVALMKLAQNKSPAKKIMLHGNDKNVTSYF